MTSTEIDFCLLIPCFNNTVGLIKSLQSIQYNKGAYHILIIDDGSPQPVNLKQLTGQYQIATSVEILTLPANKGVAFALNHGLKWIKEHLKTKYIARLDCGDLCSPLRFEKQVEYLNKNPSIGLIGTWCYFKNVDDGSSYKFTTSTKHDDIQREMHFKNVFIHPTVMFRFEVLEKDIFYPTQYNYAEDYAFFWHILKVFKCAVLDEFLVTCEINKSGISIFNRKEQIKDRKQILQQYSSNKLLKALGLLRLYILSLLPASFVLKLKKLA